MKTIPSINCQQLSKKLSEKHVNYMNRYSANVKRHLSDQLLERETAYSRLKLIGKAFLDAKIIANVTDVDVVGYEKSLALSTSQLGASPIYILNDCTEIIVASGSWASEDPLSRLIMIASTGRGVYEKHRDVLNDNFNWDKFAERILDILHETIYPREDAMRDFLNL